MRRLYSRLYWVVALALFVRSLIPMGIMLAPSALSDGIVVVICTGHGPMLAMSSDAETSSHPGQKKSASSECPFAAGGLSTFDPPAIELAHTVVFGSVVYRLFKARFDTSPKPGTLSARDPPLTIHA